MQNKNPANCALLRYASWMYHSCTSQSYNWKKHRVKHKLMKTASSQHNAHRLHYSAVVFSLLLLLPLMMMMFFFVFIRCLLFSPAYSYYSSSIAIMDETDDDISLPHRYTIRAHFFKFDLIQSLIITYLFYFFSFCFSPFFLRHSLFLCLLSYYQKVVLSSYIDSFGVKNEWGGRGHSGANCRIK